MDRGRILAEAERVVAGMFDRLEQTTILPARDETRPGGWEIVGRIQAYTALQIETRIVAVNAETGERRIVKGWWPTQPYELRDVKPDWAYEPHPLKPLDLRWETGDEGAR